MGKAIASTASYPEKPAGAKSSKPVMRCGTWVRNIARTIFSACCAAMKNCLRKTALSIFRKALTNRILTVCYPKFSTRKKIDTYRKKARSINEMNRWIHSFTPGRSGITNKSGSAKDSRGRDAPGFWQQRRDYYEFEFMGMRVNELQIDHPVPVAKTPGKISLNRWARG